MNDLETILIPVYQTGKRVNLKKPYPDNYMPVVRRARRNVRHKASVFGCYDGGSISSEIFIKITGDNILTFSTFTKGFDGRVKNVSTSMPVREFQQAIIEAS